MSNIQISKLTTAQHVSGWNICLWGNPKLTVYCGNCSGMFKTREYVQMTDRNYQIAVFCPYCSHYNLTGLYPK